MARKRKKVRPGTLADVVFAKLPDYEGSLLDKFDKVVASVTQDRGKIYGHPYTNMRRVDIMRAAIRECGDPIGELVLMEVAKKIARLIQTPDHIDSWIDIAGWARVGVMCIQRRTGHPDYPPKTMTVDDNND